MNDNPDLFNILSENKKNPKYTQRELAEEFGFSLGKLSYCLKALKTKGFVKIENFKRNPEKMSYWQLFFNMYKFKADLRRSKDHFEAALVNFCYGYQLSKLPNFTINGYMGKLRKHHSLINKIEKVLFN